MGNEWIVSTFYREFMLSKFSSDSHFKVYREIPHEMVTSKGSKMKSSGGEALLIDEILDRVAATEKIDQLVADSSSRLGRETLARIVVVGYFLSRISNKPIEFSWDLFCDERHNPAWLVAKGWSRANRNELQSANPNPSDTSYRFAILQSQRFRPVLLHAASTFDMSHVMRYLVHLCEWYVITKSSLPLERAMRTTIHAALSSLGLLGSDVGSSSRP
jgi:arginyl-tRNA synthetase